MAEPIKIDLRDLTPEKLAECKSHMGACSYQSPCVIGTLLPEGARRRFDRFSDSAVGDMVARGLIHLPDEQLRDACGLQSAFDHRVWERVLSIAAKYMSTPTGGGKRND